VMIAEIGRLFDYVSQAVEIEVDGRTFWLRPVGPEVLDAPNVVAAAIAESLGKSYGWATAFMFTDLPQAAELFITISGISGFDDD